MDTFTIIQESQPTKKVDISLRQLIDIDETGGILAGTTTALGKIENNQILTAYAEQIDINGTLGKVKIFRFKNLASLMSGGTGIAVSTTASNITTITNTGVTSIIAGTNITISPVTGIGNVTINSTGGANSTVYVFNMNSFAVPNVSLFYGVYLGGTPVSPAVVATQYGAPIPNFFPGYPMPAGTASTLVVILRAAQVAPTSTVYVKIANTDTSTFGPVVTIAAGSAAGTYTDNSATVSFTTNQRLTVVASNPFVSGATSSGTLSTGSFKYAI
jgi:hypothetical protein